MNKWSKLVLGAVVASFVSSVAVKAQDGAADANKAPSTTKHKGKKSCKGKKGCKGAKDEKKEEPAGSAPGAEETK